MFIGFRWYGQYNKCRFRGRNLSCFGSTTAAFFGTGKETRAVVWKMGKKKQRMLEAFWNLIRIIDWDWLPDGKNASKWLDQEWQMAGFSCGTRQLWQEIFISCRMPFKKMHGLDCIRMRVNILFCCYPTQAAAAHWLLSDLQRQLMKRSWRRWQSSWKPNVQSLSSICHRISLAGASLLLTMLESPPCRFTIYSTIYPIRRHSQAGPCFRRQNDCFPCSCAAARRSCRGRVSLHDVERNRLLDLRAMDRLVASYSFHRPSNEHQKPAIDAMLRMPALGRLSIKLLQTAAAS